MGTYNEVYPASETLLGVSDTGQGLHHALAIGYMR